MKKQKLPIYIATIARLLMDWRLSQGISRYEVAKQSGIHINTIKRLEDSEGGITFEDGLRYLLFAETHKSKPCLMKSFIRAMASYQSEAEMAETLKAQQKQQDAESRRKALHRLKTETEIRQSIQEEMTAQLQSLTTSYSAKTEQLEAQLQAARDHIATLETEQKSAAIRHQDELTQAKLQGLEEAKQEYEKNSWFSWKKKK